MKQKLSTTLLRANEPVGNLLQALSHSIKEIRVTGFLAYLIARNPQPFLDLFQCAGDAINIEAEAFEASTGRQRADIRIKTTRETVVVECKIDATDPTAQLLGYVADRHIVISQHYAVASTDGVTYFRWDDIASILKAGKGSRAAEVSFLSTELLNHLQEHNLVMDRAQEEIYARDLTDETVDMYLNGHLYSCDYTDSPGLSSALYFAPYFGNSAPDYWPSNFRIAAPGFSYCSRIEKIEVYATYAEFERLIIATRGEEWMHKHRPHCHSVKSWHFPQKRYLLFLGPPRHFLDPPLTKAALGRTGHLGKHNWSFDKLLSRK